MPNYIIHKINIKDVYYRSEPIFDKNYENEN